MFDYSAVKRLSDQNPYDSKIVKRCIILVRQCSNDQVVTTSKAELFTILSNIVYKNIENFFYLLRSYDNIIHTRDDMVSESYIVLENCLKNYDMKMNKHFYMYYNKGLTRAFVRIMEKYYYKHRFSMRVSSEMESVTFTSTESALDFIEFYFDLFRLTEEERRVARSKLSKQKIQDFLDENPDVSWNKYFNQLNGVKSKMKPMLDER